MDKTKHLESLNDQLFEDLPDDYLARANGGIAATTVLGPSYPTHYGRNQDYEYSDPA